MADPGFPGSLAGKEYTCNVGGLGSILPPGEGHGNPLQDSCLENPHGQRSLVGYSPWGCKGSEWLSIAQHSTWLTHVTEYYAVSHLKVISLKNIMAWEICRIRKECRKRYRDRSRGLGEEVKWGWETEGELNVNSALAICGTGGQGWAATTWDVGMSRYRLFRGPVRKLSWLGLEVILENFQIIGSRWATLQADGTHPPTAQTRKTSLSLYQLQSRTFLTCSGTLLLN